MSFDIFLQCFHKGEPAPIPRKVFDAIFGPHDTHPQLRESAPGYVVVKYPDGSHGAIYCGEDEGGNDATGMMFNHCGGPSFWADLYRLLECTRSIIYWPDQSFIYVYANPSVLGELPMPDFKDAIAVLVCSGDDIVKAIENS
jgi:hypothetical protein